MASAAVVSPLVGYPRIIAGGKKFIAFDWTAPNPYVAGGVIVDAQAGGFNWGAFESGQASVAQSNNYWALIRFFGNGAQKQAKIVVYVSATGLEAGAIDLSAEIFRITMVGE